VKRLGIIGTFVWDTVWTLEDQAAGRAFESWGGVTFSLASAAATRPEGWEIVPIAHVGEDLVGEVHAFLDTLGGIGSRKGIVPVDVPNNRVTLVYGDAARREETLTGGVPGWTWPQLASHLEELDALYVNFLAGWELELATAQALRGFRESGRPVYADLHSLFLGPPRPDGPREPRPLPRWAEWLRCFDAVQMNEHEFELLTGRQLNDATTLGRLNDFGPRAVFVTRGSEGASYLGEIGFPQWPRESMYALQCGDVPAIPCPAGGDPTGCGDVWGAAAFTGLLAGIEVPDAVARAHAVAAAKMEHRGGSGLYEHLVARRKVWERAGGAAVP
jgi:sugar/nucleoside kinase (ribokinase family)